jgi:FAD dependent oxidoreductase
VQPAPDDRFRCGAIGQERQPDGATRLQRVNDAYLDAIANADTYPYWYDDIDEPDSNPTLVRTESCDLCIVGGGYTGLWTAIIAKERDPNRDVVLIEASDIGSGASGRNGGFIESSLTHGIANGQERFPDELPLLEELGLKNLNEIEAAIERYKIDCDYERTGVIDVATTPHNVEELREDFRDLRALGQKVEWYDQEAMQREINSPTYLAGLERKERAAIVDPARLVWGLKAAQRPPASSATVSARSSRRRSAGCEPGESRCVPTPTRHCSSESSSTWSRSTTTAW